MCVCQSKAGEVTDYERGDDVLDIWFDSGTSWAAVLGGEALCSANLAKLRTTSAKYSYTSDYTCVFLEFKAVSEGCFLS